MAYCTKNKTMKTPEQFLNYSEFSASQIMDSEESYIEKEDVLELMTDYANSILYKELSQLWRWYDEAGMHGAANVVLGKLRKLESTIATK